MIVLDANEDIVSKPALFKAAWNDLYKGTIEYRGNNEVKAVDARAKTVKTDFDTIKGDVLNVLPPMRAGDIARTAGLLTPNTRWCGVDWLSMESTAHKGIHVLGDATLSAPAMPKSGHMANNHGKLAAAAIIELMNGRAPNPQPVVANTCYSFVSDKEVIHVASVHRYDPAQKTLTVVPGASGVTATAGHGRRTYGAICLASHRLAKLSLRWKVTNRGRGRALSLRYLPSPRLRESQPGSGTRTLRSSRLLRPASESLLGVRPSALERRQKSVFSASSSNSEGARRRSSPPSSAAIARPSR